MYNAYVTRLKNVRPHSNADRMLLADCFGNTICVGLGAKNGDIGVYFPTDGQLSVEYAEKNNLVRKKDENGKNIGGYLDPDKRNITAIKLRGEKSDGLFMPLESLEYTGVDISTLTEGTVINVVNGHEICCKYIPRQKTRSNNGGGKVNKTRKKKVAVAPLFAEHADTEQLAYNLNAFKKGDLVEITLKMHGTSGRTGYLPKIAGYKRTLLDRLFRREGTPIYDWGYVTGTRRVVLEDYDGGFYGDNSFREPHAAFFEGKLQKGETVYYEIVGFTNTGAPIMGTVDNKKTQDKEFIKKYGKTTTFSYGCAPSDEEKPQSACYVYRMTMTNEDGYVVEYSPDYMRYRCEQMGANCVPVLWKGYIPETQFVDKIIVKEEPFGAPTELAVSQEVEVNAGEWIQSLAEQYYDGADPVGLTHVREGVVVRIVNRPKFAAFKHKNFSFKVLEGIAKVNADAPDMEEAQEVEN
jgi:hypothetical protein